MNNNQTVPGIGPGAWDNAILAREQERKALNTATRILRLFCRHEHIRFYEKNKLSLVCARCGHQTAGWELK